MFVKTFLEQKKILDLKIDELKLMLKTCPGNNNIADGLVALLDMRQSKIMTIKAANLQVKIVITGQEVDVETAVTIRDTLGLKIEILTDIIRSDNDFSLDRLDIMKQRDRFYSDYILLDSAILKSDLSTEIGE